MKKVSKLFTTALTATALALTSTASFAATTDEVSSAIIEETLTNLNVETTDADLLAALTEDLTFAIEEEIINEDVIAQATTAVDDGTELVLDEEQDANTDTQFQLFDESKSVLGDAFEAIKLQFQQCREEATAGVSQCAVGLGLKMQIALTEQLMAQVQTRQQSLEGLTGDELAKEQEELDALTLRLQERITKAEAKLVKLQQQTSDAVGQEEDVAKLEQLQIQAQEQVRVTEQLKKPQVENSNQPSMAPSNSNSGSNGSSNGNSSNGNETNSNSNSSSNGKLNSSDQANSGNKKQ